MGAPALRKKPYHPRPLIGLGDVKPQCQIWCGVKPLGTLIPLALQASPVAITSWFLVAFGQIKQILDEVHVGIERHIYLKNLKVDATDFNNSVESFFCLNENEHELPATSADNA